MSEEGAIRLDLIKAHPAPDTWRRYVVTVELEVAAESQAEAIAAIAAILTDVS